MLWDKRGSCPPPDAKLRRWGAEQNVLDNKWRTIWFKVPQKWVNSGVVANLELEERSEVPFPSSPLPSLLLPYLLFPSPPFRYSPSLFPLPFLPSCPSLPQAMRSGAPCKLSQRGLGRSLSWNRISFKIWLFVATILIIFLRIYLPQTLHFFASLLEERYCITVPLVLTSFGGTASPQK